LRVDEFNIAPLEQFVEEPVFVPGAEGDENAPAAVGVEGGGDQRVVGSVDIGRATGSEIGVKNTDRRVACVRG
jgi:hypothetical protein